MMFTVVAARLRYYYGLAHQLNETIKTESGVSNSTLYRYIEGV